MLVQRSNDFKIKDSNKKVFSYFHEFLEIRIICLRCTYNSNSTFDRYYLLTCTCSKLFISHAMFTRNKVCLESERSLVQSPKSIQKKNRLRQVPMYMTSKVIYWLVLHYEFTLRKWATHPSHQRQNMVAPFCPIICFLFLYIKKEMLYG